MIFLLYWQLLRKKQDWVARLYFIKNMEPGQVKQSLVPKVTNLKKESVMTDYSELVIFFLMIPVAIQIILPLLMLIGFGMIRVVRTMFGGKKVVRGVKKGFDISEDLQLSRS